MDTPQGKGNSRGRVKDEGSFEEDGNEMNESRKPASARLQNLANLLTISVALAAIGLSVWEGRENRLHNRLSVLPHLDIVQSVTRTNADEAYYTMVYGLENTGLGPAVLSNVIGFRDGERFFDAVEENAYLEFEQFLGELEELPFAVGTFTHSRKAGEMLEQGETHLLFRITVPEIDTMQTSPTVIVRKQVVDRYGFVFCYCSVYGENCKQTNLGTVTESEGMCKL